MTGFRSPLARLALVVLPLAVTAAAIAVSLSDAAPKPAKPVHGVTSATRPSVVHPGPFKLLGAEVHGTIYALAGRRDNLSITHVAAVGGILPIFLPDISVYLKNAATAATTPPIQTDLDGAFSFSIKPAGKYFLCWSTPGYVAGCTASAFPLGGTTVTLKPTGIVPRAGVVYGRVTLKDGLPCRFVEPQFNKNTFTSVQAGTAAGPSPVVRANSAGFYLVPGLPNGAVAIKAKCEGILTSGSTTTGTVAAALNLTLGNVTPIVNAVIASQGGTMVRAVQQGSTVHVSAKVTDGGGNPLHYAWAVDPATSGFVSHDAPTADLVVPHTSGQVTIYLLAHDEKGGNTLWRVPLSTTPDKIRFSGHVLANDAASLQGATVSINGVSQQTNTAGNFAIVLPGEAARYVVTITQPGYQMLSRALYAPVVGATYKLYRAQQFPADPTKTITLTEKRTDENRGGAQLTIPANAIAAGRDGSGKRATGPLTIQLATYNRNDANDQLPGDYGGIDKTNKGVALQSYGATDIVIRDASNNPYNLAPGTHATLRIPIDPALQQMAPASIPVWHYDVAKGMWVEDGVANRNGGFFETQVTHFSAVNMDVAFGPASCTIINVDTSIMPVPFKLQMTILSGPGVVPGSHQNQIVSDAVNAVFREPPGAQVRFDVVDSNGNVIPNASQTFTVGAPSPEGAMWPAPPPSSTPPAYDCTTTVNYNEQTNYTGPFAPHIFPPPPNGFLTFKTPPAYLSPATADPLTNAYYHGIDPNGTKTAIGSTSDFDNWKTLNGFGRAGVTRVAYQNLYDLGFGRDMYMQTGGQLGGCAACIAFYVTNYADADGAGTATSGAIATVAMEYGPRDETGPTYTRFYVFDNLGRISNTAALDDFGAKYVPALCVVCHNGDIASNATVADINSSGGDLVNARFIPFDLESFAWPSDPNLDENHQAGNFKIMNKAILDHTNPASAEVKLVRHWYGTEADATLPGNFDPTTVVDDWSSHPALYRDVVKTSCRACHITRDPADPTSFQDISWGSFTALDDDASFVRILACGSPTAAKPMPQAERTFARFWLSTQPNAPIALGSAGLTSWGTPTCP